MEVSILTLTILFANYFYQLLTIILNINNNFYNQIKGTVMETTFVVVGSNLIGSKLLRRKTICCFTTD